MLHNFERFQQPLHGNKSQSLKKYINVLRFTKTNPMISSEKGTMVQIFWTRDFHDRERSAAQNQREWERMDGMIDIPIPSFKRSNQYTKIYQPNTYVME